MVNKGRRDFQKRIDNGQIAKQGDILRLGIWGWLLLVATSSAQAQVVPGHVVPSVLDSSRHSKEVVPLGRALSVGSNSPVDLAGPKPSTIRVARQPVQLRATSPTKALVRSSSMTEVDLKVPDLSELSTATGSDLIEVPDYATSVLGIEPGIMIALGGQRPWTSSLVTWEATAFCHQPLYFEDVNLERHGHSFGVFQPAVSAGCAFGHLLTLPSRMMAHHPHDCIYTLGHERPGNPTDFEIRRPPLNLSSGAAQAGVAAGLFLLIP